MIHFNSAQQSEPSYKSEPSHMSEISQRGAIKGTLGINFQKTIAHCALTRCFTGISAPGSDDYVNTFIYIDRVTNIRHMALSASPASSLELYGARRSQFAI